MQAITTRLMLQQDEMALGKGKKLAENVIELAFDVEAGIEDIDKHQVGPFGGRGSDLLGVAGDVTRIRQWG